MATQLVLLEAPGGDWRLDERTRDVGLRGVAEARAILQRTEARADDHAGTDERAEAGADERQDEVAQAGGGHGLRRRSSSTNPAA